MKSGSGNAAISATIWDFYTLSCVSLCKLTGSQRAYRLAHEAADILAERYNEKGALHPGVGEMGIGCPDVKIIIDTMLNLPLLYWTGDERKG